MTWPGTYSSGNKTALLQSGESFFVQLLQLIHNSRSWIHIQTYILEEDATGNEVLHALIDAAQRGINVYLITDGYGTKLSAPTVKKLRAGGVFYRNFSPVRWMRVGKRLHHKVVVTDEGKALVGGINIADKYRGKSTEKPWLDFALLIQGPACNQIREVCEHLWQRRFRRIHFKHADLKPSVAGGDIPVALSVNNWYVRKSEVSGAYEHIIHSAKEELLIVASYFLPGKSIRKALAQAAARGVKITVLLSGISDVPMVNRATRYLYDWLLRNKITIYEWCPSVLHGKLMVADREWFTVGSYNINRLSDYGSIELNIHVHHAATAVSVQQTIELIMEHGAEKVKAEVYAHEKSVLKQLMNFASYYFIRFLLKLFLRMSEDGRKVT
ncbi:MAG: hypothetical protein K1X81_08660 [Bacteroidia bacterium]|nr:hypothetical protein [Bacteroidia bacterium]